MMEASHSYWGFYLEISEKLQQAGAVLADFPAELASAFLAGSDRSEWWVPKSDRFGLHSTKFECPLRESDKPCGTPAEFMTTYADLVTFFEETYGEQPLLVYGLVYL